MKRRTFAFALAGCALVAGCGETPATGNPDASLADLDAGTSGHHDLKPPPDLTPVVGPVHLADTGLYSDFALRTLSKDVIHYVPRYELWSDGATKERFLFIPPGEKIDTSDMDNWVFPVGTKVWKEFRFEGQLVETRLLQKVYDNPGGWWEVAYLWNDGATDAVAAPDGAPDAGSTSHDVPSQDDCVKCHSNVSDVLIGVSAIQLSSPDGQGPLSQLAGAGLLSVSPVAEFQPPGQGNVQEALGYLHGNCGHCHNDRSVYENATVLRLRLRVGDATPEATEIYRTSINVKMFHHLINPKVDYAVVPGAPEQSQLWVRTGLRDDWQMPTVCTKVADSTGLATLHDWISQLPP